MMEFCGMHILGEGLKCIKETRLNTFGKDMWHIFKKIARMQMKGAHNFFYISLQDMKM